MAETATYNPLEMSEEDKQALGIFTGPEAMPSPEAAPTSAVAPPISPAAPTSTIAPSMSAPPAPAGGAVAPAIGSTEDLESKANARYQSPPAALDPQAAYKKALGDAKNAVLSTKINSPEYYAAKGDEHRLKAENPYGSAGNHPGIFGKIEHGLAMAGNIAGNILAPGVMGMTPGTQMHEHAEAQQDQAGYTGAIENNLKVAQTDAANEKAASPKDWQEMTGGATDPAHPELGQQQAFYDRTDPKSRQYAGPMAAKTGAGPLVGPEIANANAGFLDRFKILNPGATELPPQYTLPPNASKEQRDFVDKQIEQVEKAQGTKAQQDQTRQMQADAASQRQQNFDQTRDDKATAATEKKEAADKAAFEKNIAPLKADIDFAKNYVDNKNYTGSNDDAMLLKYFDLAKPETGFRLTTAEMDRQSRTQSYKNSVEAKIHHALTGTWFSDQQRQEMLASMTEIAKEKALARQMSATPESRKAATDSMASAKGGASVKVGGVSYPVSADGTFTHNGHSYKPSADGKSATLVK